MNKTLQDNLKLIPLFYASIVIIGFIKLYIYYRFFNINISEFLFIGEILVSFLDDMTVYSISLIVFALIILLSEGVNKLNSASSEQDGNKINKLYYKVYKIVITIGIILILSLFVSRPAKY